MTRTISGRPAPAGFFAPYCEKSEKSDRLARKYPTDAIVRMQRLGGEEYFLRVPGEHLDRLIALADKEFVGLVEQKK